MSEQGHNSKAADDRLRLYIERIERVEESQRELAEDKRDIYTEVKAVGYDPKLVREVVKIRKMDPVQRAEHEALLETYLAALGMA